MEKTGCSSIKAALHVRKLPVLLVPAKLLFPDFVCELNKLTKYNKLFSDLWKWG